MDALTASLIVCTRNRASRLPEFLERIALLEAPPGGWELILVDNASTDATPALIGAFAARATFAVRYVHAPIPGLARARNVGLARAEGRIVAFTDDDCYPSPDYLRVIVDVFQERRVGFVGGRVVLHDPTEARVCVKDVERPFEIRPRTFVPAGAIHGANMAVLREVVDTIGGFDPQLGAGTACVAGEDIDYVARAAWAGWPGCYDPRPIVAHHHGRKPGVEAERQQRGYDYGRGAYYVKFLLDRRARGTYLRGWYRRTRRGFGTAGIGRLGRELSGATRYLRKRLASRGDVPGLGDVAPATRPSTDRKARGDQRSAV